MADAIADVGATRQIGRHTMTGSPLRRRLTALEAVAEQRNRFVVFVKTDQTDAQALRAQALADGIDPARLPLGTVLARARQTPAKAAEQAAGAANRGNAGGDPCISKEDYDAVLAVDIVHVEADTAALWFLGLLAYRQIVLRDGVLLAYAETLQELFLHGIARSPLGGSASGIAFRDATSEQRLAMIEQFRRDTAGTLRPLAETL